MKMVQSHSAMTRLVVLWKNKAIIFLPLDKAIASRAVFVIVSGLDGWAETLLEPAK